MKKLFFATIAATFALSALTFGVNAGAQDAASAPAKTGDAAAGQKKNAMCIGCHGIVGYQSSFPEVYKVPKIAGQNAQYLASALTAYKKGERKHPSMRGIAESLSEQDILDLAAYYAGQGGPRAELPAEPQPAPQGEVAELLTKGNCAACHGANFSKPIDGSYPKLAGQHADYLFHALKAYKTDNHALVGRGNAIMATQAKPYSTAELKQIAGYIASLPSELQTIPQSKFK
jgi:cytochrome c553